MPIKSKDLLLLATELASSPIEVKRRAAKVLDLCDRSERVIARHSRLSAKR